MRILVAEDTEDSRVLLVDQLEVHGYTVDSAVNGAEAFEKALATLPDLIISDILMPEMDGFEFCKKIKKTPQLKNIPFIFYTATYTDPDDQRFALSLGADRFIIKPEDPFVFLNIIEEACANHKDREHETSLTPLIQNGDFDALHSKSLSRKLNKKVQELEGQKEQLRIITDAVPALIAEIDELGHYQYVNQQYENWFHRSRNDIIGKKISEVVDASVYSVIKPYIERAIKGEEVSYEGYVFDSDGNRRFILARYIPYKNKQGMNKGCFSFINDLTEQKLAEEEKQQLLDQLRNAQKMDALGQLTSGIAHDFNNILGVILGYAEILSREAAEQPKQLGFVHEIKQAGERGAKLTQKLLSFTRQKSVNESRVQINNLLLDAQNMLEKTLTVRIKLVLDLDDDLWPVWLDSSDLEDALLNMSINAMHAIDGSGQLTFKTYNKKINKVEAENLNLSPGDYVVLSVTDTGCGMDDATKDKVFEPFYTTKGERGTGLGLSQVYGFVKRSGGGIMVNSESGQGSHFVLYFPRSSKLADETVNHTANANANLKGKESLLVVDDEKAMTELAYEILTAQGYHVLTANGGKQALAILERETVDLLITDVIMPKMDGYQLAAQVQQSYPHIRIQLVSGYADDYDRNIPIESGIQQDTLIKPYVSSTLLSHVRHCLDNSGTKKC